MGWDSVWIWQKQHDYLLWQNIEDVYMEGCGGGSVVSDDYLRWLDMVCGGLYGDVSNMIYCFFCFNGLLSCL